MPTSQNINPYGPAYRAYLNEHPYSWEMLAELNQFGVKGLLHPDNNMKRQQSNVDDFAFYQPTNHIQGKLPISEFDFSHDGTYSIYNWEIFFHSVSLIARQLRLNNKHAEAIQWLSYIFDPTSPDEPAPNQLFDLRFWQIKPFVINVTQGSIQNMIRLLSENNANLTIPEQQMRADFEAQIMAWRKHPFDPHIIAAMRPRAYMLWTVMEYVTTLADWGDHLFRQDTMESINEAINLYVMAQEILGPRPRQVERPTPAPVSFNDIMNNLSSFSNILVAFENHIPGLNLQISPNQNQSNQRGLSEAGSNTGSNTIMDLLFCIPDNPKLTALWDRVEDRLFKIRNCMNIDGKRRELALFAPPIDPAMLVQAAAAGLSIESALADLASPLPHYRFTYLVQKANEFCNEVNSLGSQLLGLLEKKDAEELALFRQVHEQNILKAARALKEMSIQEAKQNKATLESSKNLIQIKLDDYSNREYKNSREEKAMELNNTAEGLNYSEQGLRLTAGLLNLIPELNAKIHIQAVASGVTADTKITSGQKIASTINYGANALALSSSILRNKASQSLTYASYDRRLEEWNLQIKLATEELAQVDRQLLGADIRIAVNEKDLSNHDLQMDQSDEMHQWLKDKYTNEKLYQWMLGQVKTVYRQAFDLAYNLAKKAQVCYEYELGTSAPNFIQYGQWDSTKSGLLSGERLSVQLKQLENAFIENNKREYELSKNISLALLDPLALEELKATGTCEIEIPEVIFNLDHPSHYFRRIKSVSLSVPCIAGVHTNVNATLSLTKAGIRKNLPAPSNPPYTPPVLSPITLDSIPVESIATSSSQSDSGLFELNFRDERYIPFEGKGAVSKWLLQLTDAQRQFDYNTISDVVIHLKYTAREGGQVFAGQVSADTAHTLNLINQGFNESKYHYAFSLRHDMPNEWYTFKNTGLVNVTILQTRLPYVIQALSPVIDQLGVLAITNLTSPPGTKIIKINNQNLTINLVPGTKTFYDSEPVGSLGTVAFNTPFTVKEDSLDKDDVTDLVIVARINV